MGIGIIAKNIVRDDSKSEYGYKSNLVQICIYDLGLDSQLQDNIFDLNMIHPEFIEDSPKNLKDILIAQGFDESSFRNPYMNPSISLKECKETNLNIIRTIIDLENLNENNPIQLEERSFGEGYILFNLKFSEKYFPEESSDFITKKHMKNLALNLMIYGSNFLEVSKKQNHYENMSSDLVLSSSELMYFEENMLMNMNNG